MTGPDGDLPEFDDREAGDSVTVKVLADLDALVSGHPMGEALGAIALKLARLLDAGTQHMAVAGISRELRETLLELARLEVDDDDDLEAELSRPDLPSALRDPEES